jgi:multidrug efflux system outer membrane protein
MVSAALMLAGCSSEPLTPVADHTDSPSRFRGADTSPNNIQAKWWLAYHDEVLNKLVETTLHDNPNLGIVYARLRAAQEQVKATNADSLPRIDGMAAFGNSRTSANSPFGQALGKQPIKGNQYTSGLSASWEPDIWRRVARAVDVADTKVQLARIEIDAYMLILCAEVVQFYWQMRSAEAELTVLQAIVQSRTDTVGLLDSRLQKGLISELDLARAKVELANAQADLHEARKRRTLMEHSLATLTNRPISDFRVAPVHVDSELADTQALPLPPPPAMAPGLPAQILQRRPDMAESTQHIRAALASRDIAETALYPTIKLTGDFGFASKELRDLFDSGSRQFSLGPLSISLPLLDGGRIRANIATADARYQEAVAAHQSKLLLALKEVDDAMAEIAANEGAVQARQQGLAHARRAHEVARSRYDKGLANYLDVMDTERALLAIERNMLRERGQALVASVQLVRALGGSWNAGEAVTPAQLYQ